MPIDLELTTILLVLFAATQIIYTCTFAIDAYLYTRPVNFVDMRDAESVLPKNYPHIVLFYPVLRELEETMRTTFRTIAQLDYPEDKYQVIAIPNGDDLASVEHLRKLASEFPFLQIIEVPPTSDASWDIVWDAWNANPKAYWWHSGRRGLVRDLPPKKTRQLIFAFYHMRAELSRRGLSDFVINYIDADSCPPPDHFMGAVAGMQRYDVLQAQNVAGNLLESQAAAWHAFDHMTWDGMKYPHLSADGNQPYWVLGKGLFFKASDLEALGGFHPWIAIEDPEVGMRFWKNGKKLGILSSSLVEEVPATLYNGIVQRKRWVCGFFQSLTQPLGDLGFTLLQKIKAWMNFLPCMLLWVNVIGLPPGLWALWVWFTGQNLMPLWLTIVSLFNIFALFVTLTMLYIRTWKRTALVLETRRDRILYMLRINPLSLMVWWLIWLIPLWQGWRMFVGDGGLVWDRTVKTDANHALILVRTEPVRVPAYVPPGE